MTSSPRMEHSPRSRSAAPSSPVAIMWDYENVRLPTGVSAFSAVSSLRTLSHSYGHLISAKAYMETSLERAPRQTNIRSELQSSGVSIIDTPHNGRKEVADQMICVDLMAFALDVKAPATIILVSGDKDFAYVLSTLRNRRYKVILVTMMSNISVSLTAQADEVLDWRRDVLRLQVPPPMVASRIHSLPAKPGTHKRPLESSDALNQRPMKRVASAAQPSAYPLPSKPIILTKSLPVPLPVPLKAPVVVIEVDDEDDDDEEQVERDRLAAKALRKAARKAAKAVIAAQLGKDAITAEQMQAEEQRKKQEEEMREKTMEMETLVLSDEEDEVVVPSPGKGKGRQAGPIEGDDGSTMEEASNISGTFSFDSPLSKPLLTQSTPLRRLPLAETPIRIIRPKRGPKATQTLAQSILRIPSTPVPLQQPSPPAFLTLQPILDNLTSTPLPSTSSHPPSSPHSPKAGDESIEILSFNDPPSSDMDFGTPLSCTSYTLPLPPSLITHRLFSHPITSTSEEEDYIAFQSSPAPAPIHSISHQPLIAFNLPPKTLPAHKSSKFSFPSPSSSPQVSSNLDPMDPMERIEGLVRKTTRWDKRSPKLLNRISKPVETKSGTGVRRSWGDLQQRIGGRLG